MEFTGWAASPDYARTVAGHDLQDSLSDQLQQVMTNVASVSTFPQYTN